MKKLNTPKKVTIVSGHFIKDVTFICLGANACIGGCGVKRWRTDLNDLGRNYRKAWTSIHCGR